MGGATGMHAAATILRGRISHLAVNDIGPELPQAAIRRILDYVGAPPAFDTVTELEAWLRAAYKPYGWQSDEQWRRMAETSMRRLPDGRVTAHYDPTIVGQFSHHPDDYDRWEGYDSLRLPVLLLRGADPARPARAAHRLPRLRPRPRPERRPPDRRHPPIPGHAGRYGGRSPLITGDLHETHSACRAGRPVHEFRRGGEGFRRGPRL
jgi:hypothetical protein